MGGLASRLPVHIQDQRAHSQALRTTRCLPSDLRTYPGMYAAGSGYVGASTGRSSGTANSISWKNTTPLAASEKMILMSKGSSLFLFQHVPGIASTASSWPPRHDGGLKCAMHRPPICLYTVSVMHEVKGTQRRKVDQGMRPAGVFLCHCYCMYSEKTEDDRLTPWPAQFNIRKTEMHGSLKPCFT